MLEFLFNALARVREDEEGQTLIEYALIGALVAVALVAALGLLTGGIETTFTNIINALTGANGG